MNHSCTNITDVTADQLAAILKLAVVEPADLGRPLDGQGAALIFEKPSNRTRHSTEIAVAQLGGHPVYTRGEEVGFDERETVEDIARVLDGYHRVIAARVFDHRVIERLAAASSQTVVNLLSDYSHPLQAITDVLTMEQRFGSLDGFQVAWVGDYTNVARSLSEACVMLGADVRLGCPHGFGADDTELERINGLGVGSVIQTTQPLEAVEGAQAVHTDTWFSMGSEGEKAERQRAFEGFTVDDAMMAAAARDAVFMHCLPAYRGVEVTESVIDGPQSLVFPQAHNRLHAARATLAHLLLAR